MRKFIIERNAHFEEEKRLVEVVGDTKNEIMIGDYYHDKISNQIDGFFIALDYLGIEYEVDEDGEFGRE
jgi:hypothetical protein